MQQPAALSDQVAVLAAVVTSGAPGLAPDLTALLATLEEAVSGCAGFRVTVVQDGQPVRLTVLVGGSSGRGAVTSLRVPLNRLSAVLGDRTELVVWSTVPGALVDLSADLAHVLRRVDAGADGDRDAGPGRAADTSGVVLDADLPVPAGGSQVEGLDELATVQRATGVLIGQGHDPATVLVTLRSRAAADGFTPYGWAVRLLSRTTAGEPGNQHQA